MKKEVRKGALNTIGNHRAKDFSPSYAPGKIFFIKFNDGQTTIIKIHPVPFNSIFTLYHYSVNGYI